MSIADLCRANGLTAVLLSLRRSASGVFLQASDGAYFIQAISNEMIRLSAWLCPVSERVWRHHQISMWGRQPPPFTWSQT
jgi:hypothetical protein